MTKGDSVQNGDEQQLFRGVLKLNAGVLGLTLGLITGLGLFAATLVLVIKGGDSIGPHLSLLGQYFIGYRVTLGGSVIGFLYGFSVGTAMGAFLGWVYNFVARLRERVGP
jgi:hypothetical protein